MMKRVYFVLFTCFFSSTLDLDAQQDVFWRSEAANGNWQNGNCNEIGTGSSQWWYPGFSPNNARNRPDCWDGSTNRHNLQIANNHQTTMSVNDTFWNIRALTLGSDASASRTFNSSPDNDTRGISLTSGIYHEGNSGVNHTFNVRLGIDAANIYLLTANSGATSTYNRTIFGNNNNVVFQGAGNTVVNGIISGSGASIQKEGTGLLTLNAANTYGGNATIIGGTLRLGSATATVGGTTTGVRIGAGGTFNLNNFSTTVRFVSEIGFANAGTVSLGSGTLTIQDTEATTRFQSSINGTGNLVYESSLSSILSLFNAQGYTGSTTVKSGTLVTGGVMQTSSITIEGGTFRTTGSANRLAANPNVTLAGGTFNPQTNETVGTLTLTGNATIDLSVADPMLNFAASNAVTWSSGQTLSITGWQGTPGQPGTAGRIFFGNSESGLNQSQLMQISFGGNFVGAMILSSGEVVPEGGLPVELTAFNANCQPESVIINWTTASELNAAHYEIEISRDGFNWSSVGVVNAAGTTNQTTQYQFATNNLGGLQYFRLVQTDLDGQFEIFGPISSLCQIHKNELLVFPNPAEINTSFTIQIKSREFVADARLRIMDIMGKLVYFHELELNEGTTHIPMKSDILSSGSYVLQLESDNQKFEVVRFVVR